VPVLDLPGRRATPSAPATNIKDFLTWTDDDPYWQARQYQETAQMIEDLTCITIAAVDGVCTGGGLELTLTCDFVVGDRPQPLGMPKSIGTSRLVGAASRVSRGSPGGVRRRNGILSVSCSIGDR